MLVVSAANRVPRVADGTGLAEPYLQAFHDSGSIDGERLMNAAPESKSAARRILACAAVAPPPRRRT
ncbi:hypothetical protein [Burkholderia sp. Bp8998]|uniref:hypothetical protein n=1 Tax=Burkholderia sp. Bp8998 TaxID=2184557 RepID=UPI000F5A3CD9|nr:hypothetical protein [Burkholderia sp. Bp8998]